MPRESRPPRPPSPFKPSSSVASEIWSRCCTGYTSRCCVGGFHPHRLSSCSYPANCLAACLLAPDLSVEVRATKPPVFRSSDLMHILLLLSTSPAVSGWAAFKARVFHFHGIGLRGGVAPCQLGCLHYGHGTGEQPFLPWGGRCVETWERIWPCRLFVDGVVTRAVNVDIGLNTAAPVCFDFQVN